MLGKLRNFWERERKHPHVRPWALSAPILVLLVALPLLRPLRQAGKPSDNEAARLATIQAIVENRTLAIDQSLSDFRQTQDSIRIVETPIDGSPVVHSYSKQAPVMAMLLAGPYWVMRHGFGLSFDNNPELVAYLLTILGVTLPVAGATGLVYKMGRIFELRRPWRAGLAFATTFGSGLISYATVLNSNAPAAALVLAAYACLFHVAVSAQPSRTGAWLILAGFCASLAAVIDLAAPVFLILLLLVILVMRWPTGMKIGGLLLYVLGALPPLVLHAALTIPITGDLRPPFLHPEPAAPTSPAALVADDGDGDDFVAPPVWWIHANQIIHAVIGSRGLLSHFPVVLVGIGGVFLVLRRHWPLPTKTLAVVTVMAGLAIIATYVGFDANWNQPMFSVRWFVLFLPLLLFWSGAWLRKSHHPVSWAIVSLLLSFSIVVSLIGATDPFVPAKAGQYTAYVAAKRLFHRTPAPTVRTPIVAGR